MPVREVSAAGTFDNYGIGVFLSGWLDALSNPQTFTEK
jgi:hypothetical protein